MDKLAEERNKKRRQEYEENPDYRKKVQVSARDSYRKIHDVDTESHIAVIDEQSLAEIGSVRNVLSTVGGESSLLTFDINEAATALGDYNAHVMYRWMRNGLIPRMRYKASKEETGRMVNVYVIQEISEMARILLHHQKNISCYFSKNHQVTIDKIATAVESVRNSL